MTKKNIYITFSRIFEFKLSRVLLEEDKFYCFALPFISIGYRQDYKKTDNIRKFIYWNGFQSKFICFYYNLDLQTLILLDFKLKYYSFGLNILGLVLQIYLLDIYKKARRKRQKQNLKNVNN